ncbi:competence protein ComK [Cytobacillus firmus]|uniref:Competence protein ComK n=2 Tax=Cytobacillus TaxID=2675230 RepID=A0A366K6G5_CYTFI|nr:MULTISPECIES: competence protein ComK [Cytobacillus]RBP96181.1 competence protein ComK [Cytobacillus firmus]TDX45094.1 competence protein ComK [Cytobacillus oceanisediminis]
MKAKQIVSYIIVPETKSIRAEFNDNGECHSLVLEGDYTFKVDMKPAEIIDESLKYYGFDLNGAISGSRAILGQCKAVPVRIPGEINMYWFPHTSPGQEECVWFALHHVEAILAEDHGLSNVYVSGGHCFKLNAAEKDLTFKYDRTEKLESRISKRTVNTFSFIMERTTKTYTVEKGKRNYIITRKKDK